MKKIAAIILLLVFCNGFFYYSYFSFSIIKAKIEAVVLLAKSGQVKGIVKASIDQLQKDEVDEVWYHNKLYDVAERERIDGKEWVFLLQDSTEEQLLEHNNDYFKDVFEMGFVNNDTLRHPEKAKPITDKNYIDVRLKFKIVSMGLPNPIVSIFVPMLNFPPLDTPQEPPEFV